MDNIERLNKYINRAERLVADTERRIAAGEGWLDIQLDSLQYHLDNLHKQRNEEIKLEEIREAFLNYESENSSDYGIDETEGDNEDFARLRTFGNNTVSIHHEILDNSGVFDRLLK
jgi:hypothetical protein